MDESQTRLLGFDGDAGLGDLLRGFGIIEDYRAMLPSHLAGVLGKQHPGVTLHTITLLSEPDLRVGGMPREECKEEVQDLDATLMLRVNLSKGSQRASLDIRLVLRATQIDSVPSVESDLFVVQQRSIN